MSKYLIQITRQLMPKNSMHEEYEEYILPFNNSLITGEGKRQLFVKAVKKKVEELNKKHSRCTDEDLNAWDYESNEKRFRLGPIDFTIIKIIQEL